MQHADEFRRCLIDCDTAGIRRLWLHVSPHLPQPATDVDALISIHHARTSAKSVPFHLRAYSHRWLVDNGYPSGMPDELKPKAERIYPRVVSAVGIAVKATSLRRRESALAIRDAMSYAVAEAYADGKTDSAFISQRMKEARARIERL